REEQELVAACDGHRRTGCCNEGYCNDGRETGSNRRWPERGAEWIHFAPSPILLELEWSTSPGAEAGLRRQSQGAGAARALGCQRDDDRPRVGWDRRGAPRGVQVLEDQLPDAVHDRLRAAPGAAPEHRTRPEPRA